MTETEYAVAEDVMGVVSQWLPGYLDTPSGQNKVALVRLNPDGSEVYRYTPMGDDGLGDYTGTQPRYYEVRVLVREVKDGS